MRTDHPEPRQQQLGDARVAPRLLEGLLVGDRDEPPRVRAWDEALELLLLRDDGGHHLVHLC